MIARASRCLTSAALAAVLAIGGCASQDYVDHGFAATNARIDAIAARTESAHARAEEAHALARGDFQHQVLLTDDSVRFETDSAALSAYDQQALAGFAGRVKAENRSVHIEVIGHADATAHTSHNLALGQRRADAVMRFLHLQGIPLHRMNAISYGESAPRASNATAGGRAENRRVVLVVMG
jgi:outer membrane protein OmpA-like peptidoglycan-associated protein